MATKIKMVIIIVRKPLQLLSLNLDKRLLNHTVGDNPPVVNRAAVPKMKSQSFSLRSPPC